MFGLFFVLWFIVFSIFSGGLIALAVHAASKCFALPSLGSLPWRSRWPGLTREDRSLSVTWALFLLPWGILWIAGAAIEFVSRRAPLTAAS